MVATTLKVGLHSANITDVAPVPLFRGPASIEDVCRWAGSEWRLARWRGILFFPIHRVAPCLRRALGPVDALLGRTPVARWSSYYVCELERLA